MKYLKSYEKCTEEDKLKYDNCDDTWYWQLSNKYPDILIAFDKLGIPKDQFNWLWTKDNTTSLKDFYVFKTIYENGNSNWSYAGLSYQNPSYNKPPVFMGKVEITTKDKENWFINQKAEKYNL